MSLKEYVDYLVERKEELSVERPHWNTMPDAWRAIASRNRAFQTKCDVCRIWESCPDHPAEAGGFDGLEHLFGGLLLSRVWYAKMNESLWNSIGARYIACSSLFQ